MYNYLMNVIKKNIFLTGAPSSGKTTIIKKVIAGLGVPARGFYTEEVCSGGTRVGFLMKTLDGTPCQIKKMTSKCHIR